MTRIRSICVYCGSSNRVADRFKDVARDLGTEIGRRGFQLVYGGGRVGLMGITADAALDASAPVVGIIPAHIQEREVEHVGLTELLVVDSMHTRKRLMVDRSDAFVVLPGGLGTLDETFEILTWKQLQLHDKPIVFLNIDGYWDALLAAVDKMVDEGFARPQHRDMFAVVDTIEQAFAALAAAPQPVVDPETKWL